MRKTQEIIEDRVKIEPQIIGGSETEQRVMKKQGLERLQKAKRKARIRRLVFVGLLVGAVYIATRK